MAVFCFCPFLPIYVATCNLYNTCLSHTNIYFSDSRQCLRLPAGLDTKAHVSLVSDGWGNLPERIPPLSQEAECKILHALIDILNSAFSLDLCNNPRTERSRSELEGRSMDRCSRVTVAVGGGSNANCLAAELEDTGVSVANLTESGWRSTWQKVDQAVAGMKAINVIPDIVVMQCIDNNIFYCIDEDGCLNLPSKMRAVATLRAVSR